MIKRFYVHNYRCLENFSLRFEDQNSLLLLGKNGTGKSTLRAALSVLQRIARGTNRLKELVTPKDFTRGRTDAPMRFEIEVILNGRMYQYTLALELPEKFKEVRVREEQLLVDGVSTYTRQNAQVKLETSTAGFSLDWHLVALPVLLGQSSKDFLSVFQRWLASMLLLAPIPAFMSGESSGDTLWLTSDAKNFGEWFTGLLLSSPSMYTTVDHYLKGVLPDFKGLQNLQVGSETRAMTVLFRAENQDFSVPFAALSDGEKCFFLCALVLASSQENKSLFCLWDEPESHLSLDEVRQFIAILRSSFEEGGQLLVMSHHPETIRGFSDETTFLLYRRSHLEPTQIKRIDEIEISGTLVDALLRGDVTP